MKMNYKSLLVALSALFALSSCNVTDLTPTDSFTDATYWRTTSDLELYANNFYKNLGGADAFYDNNTDVRMNKSSSSFFDGSYVVPESDESWSFSTIRNINYFLNRYQTVVGDPAIINHYVAEVRFFRALEYWNKVKRYGDYPWYDKDLTLSDEELIFKGRDPRAFVVGKIIEDLEFACNNLRKKNQVATNRLYDFVAYSQLARVCLYEGTRAKYAADATLDATALLTKAATAAKHIMDNGGYALVTNATAYVAPVDPAHPLAYYALFTQLDKISGNTECILAREYKKDIVIHGVTRQLEDGGNGLTKAMINQYLCIDGKPIAGNHLYLGANTLDEELTNRDPRLYQSIDNRFLPYKLDPVKGIVVHTLPNINGNAPTGYNTMKSHHTDPNQWTANSCYTQWYLYRYAEVLLIYAEAKAELGTITQADVDASINKLRARVGMANLDITSIVVDPNWPNYGHTLTPIIYEVRRERAVELLAEGFRYDDIMRWRAGKLLENPLAVYGRNVSDQMLIDYPKTFDVNQGNLTTVVHNGVRYIQVYTNNVKNGYTWDDKYYLYPIPKGQLSLNPKLKPQNRGWE